MAEVLAERKKIVVKARMDVPEVDAAGQAKAVPSQAGPTRVDEQIMGPGRYELSPGQTFEVKIHLKEKDGRWIVMAGPGRDIEVHKVVFRMWTYDEQVDLKKKATSFDAERRAHLVDNDMLNRLKIQKFLLSWTFDRDNPRLKLFHVQGVLTDEGWDAFKRLQQNIIAYIIGEMNQIYEYNG